MEQIKNNEQLINFASETLMRFDNGEISREDAKVKLFGCAVIHKCLDYRLKLAKVTGKTVDEIIQETKSGAPEKMYVKKIN